MKAQKVMQLLQITRPTLSKYVKLGKIKVKTNPLNGRHIYDDESIFKLLNKNFERKIVGYCRVSTRKQLKDLENQEKRILEFCKLNNLQIKEIYKDIASGINFERKNFKNLLKEIIEYKISKLIITYPDRLSRISFNMFKELFQEFGCEIIIIDQIGETEKELEKEIFEEIISLIHCFSMKLYSKQRKQKISLIEKDLKLELKTKDDKS